MKESTASSKLSVGGEVLSRSGRVALLSGLEFSDAMLAASATVVGGVEVNDALFEDVSGDIPENRKSDSEGRAGSSTSSASGKRSGTGVGRGSDKVGSSARAGDTSARRPAIFEFLSTF